MGSCFTKSSAVVSTTLLLLLFCFIAMHNSVLSDNTATVYKEEEGASYYDQWTAWKRGNGRWYSSSQEEETRFAVWKENLEYIQQHNSNSDLYGFTLRMNSYGDMNETEWDEYTSCHKLDSYSSAALRGVPYIPPVNSTLPQCIDWRAKNVVTKVKNQGEYRCHACYAFAAVGALESANAIQNGNLVQLSEQQVLDCSRKYANSACHGGNYKFAWNYIVDNNGIDTASYYPYQAAEGSCQYVAKFSGASMSSMAFIQRGNETHLQSAVALVGPVAVAIDHQHRSFQFYSNGIYSEMRCASSARNLTHEMLVVGYGMRSNTASNKPYWIVKNSYDTEWGINGYMLMLRNENMCGIATNAAFPIL